MIAFFEYCCQVPVNRLGFIDNGGRLTGTAEGDTGVYLTGGVCRDCEYDRPTRAPALEPCGRSPLSGGSRLFRIYETLILTFGRACSRSGV